MFGRQPCSGSDISLLQQALFLRKSHSYCHGETISSVETSTKGKNMIAEESPNNIPVLADSDSVKCTQGMGRKTELELQSSQTAGVGSVDKNVHSTPDVSACTASCESEKNIVETDSKNTEELKCERYASEEVVVETKENVFKDFSDGNCKSDFGCISNPINENSTKLVAEISKPLNTLPTKPYRLSPNITLGRDPRYVDYPLSEGAVLDYGEVTAPGGEWSFKKVIEAGEEKIRFTPFKEGEFNIPVTYNGGCQAIFQLTVNPDPWSLWTIEEIDEKIKEFPSDQQRLSTNHKDVIGEEFSGLKVIGASRRGRSHERSGTFRDDDMGLWADPENGNFVFIVSDGAGSCKFSREGARKIIEFIKGRLEERKANVEAVWQKSLECFKPDCAIGVNLAYMARLAKGYLDEFVAQNKETHPTWTVKDFSATLLLAALKRENNGVLRLITMSIGDGAIAWYLGEREHGLMCCPDSGEFGGGTRFLTTPDVWKDVDRKQDYKAFCEQRVFCRTFTAEEAKKFQLYLMSDGVSDPWFETDVRLDDSDIWKDFVENVLFLEGENKAGIVLSDSPKVNAEKLWDWLYFKKVGNHDDRTLLMAYACESATKEVVNG